MHLQIALRIVGSLLMMFSLTMLVPVLWSFYFNDGVAVVFINAFAYTFGAGFLLWLVFHRYQAEMRIKDGFLVTVMFYLALGSFGSIPFANAHIGLSAADAFFESNPSGLNLSKLVHMGGWLNLGGPGSDIVPPWGK